MFMLLIRFDQSKSLNVFSSAASASAMAAMLSQSRDAWDQPALMAISVQLRAILRAFLARARHSSPVIILGCLDCRPNDAASNPCRA
jgi:hypothetical protein